MYNCINYDIGNFITLLSSSSGYGPAGGVPAIMYGNAAADVNNIPTYPHRATVESAQLATRYHMLHLSPNPQNLSSTTLK